MQSQQQIINYLVITLCMTCRLTEGRCQKPREPEGGFLHPDHTNYGEDGSVNYKCEPGRKTLDGGWWTTVICQNGKWSHTPQCIDEKDCITPKVEHAQMTRESQTSYTHGNAVHFECSEGYELKAGNSATCLDGKWTPLPICDKKICPAPPKMNNAVVVGQDYKPSFDEGTVLDYKCIESHEMNGVTQSTCVNGKWTETGHCVPKSDSPAPTKKPSATGDSGNRGRETGTTNPGPRGGGGHECPEPPLITNGDVISQVNKAATYQCANFYKLDGNKVIRCRNGEWDTPPTCKPNFCKVVGKVRHLKELVVPKYINNGESERFECESYYYWVATGTCRDGRINFRGCGQYSDWVIESAE